MGAKRRTPDVCGICGTTQAADGRVLKAMNAAMLHRGPDDEGLFLEPGGGIGLGARRLSVIDVGGGHQPLANESETLWAVLNGEIYNFMSLRAHLLGRGHVLATQTDTEVLVHLYEEYGPDLVHALEGMYAFAIWDSAERQLLLGRDRFGEKPLFYMEHDGVLTFASELTALLACGRADLELDPAVLDAYFVYGYVPDSASFVEGVRQLDPGYSLIWNDTAKRAEIRPYWVPPTPATVDGTPRRDLISEVGELLERSVRSRLVADVPVGVFLSGGVDSTLVAVLAAKHASGTLKTFSVGYDTGDLNETDRAARVATLVGADHHELILSSTAVAETVPRMLADLDQPVADTAFVALRALAGFAREQVTVAVGGEGADELFGGYPRYRWLARASRLPHWLPRSMPAHMSEYAAHFPRLRKASRLSDLLAPGTPLQRHVDWVTERRTSWRRRLYGPRLRELLTHDRVDRAPATVLQIERSGDVVGALMCLDQLCWLPGDVLVKADRATMQASLEFRTPFLSREVAEFAASVPSRVHVQKGGKLLLRELLAQTVPPLGGGSPKTAFRTPTVEWLRGPLAPLLTRHVQESAVYSEGWFDRAVVSGWLQEHQDRRADRSALLWPLLVLGSWFDAKRVSRAVA